MNVSHSTRNQWELIFACTICHQWVLQSGDRFQRSVLTAIGISLKKASGIKGRWISSSVHLAQTQSPFLKRTDKLSLYSQEILSLQQEWTMEQNQSLVHLAQPQSPFTGGQTEFLLLYQGIVNWENTWLPITFSTVLGVSSSSQSHRDVFGDGVVSS